MCYFLIGKTIVIGSTDDIKNNLFLFFFLSFVKLCFCVLHFREVLYLSRPERLIRADVGTGCVKL